MKTKLDEIDRQIIKYKRQGFSQRIIADTLELKEYQICYRVRVMKEKFGIVFNEEELDEIDKVIIEMKNHGIGNKQITEVLNISTGTVNYRLKKIKDKTGIVFPPKNKFLNEFEVQIYNDFQNNMNSKQIAEKYNLPQSTVASKKRKIEQAISVKIPVQKIDDTDILIKNYKEEKLSNNKIAEKVGMSTTAVWKRVKKIDKIEKKELAKMIVNLVYTKHATMEQIKKMGEYYGVDVEEALNSLEEQER